MANISIISIVFRPDNVSTAHIMADLATDLKRAGHDVTVVTATPHYNRDREAEAQQPLCRTGWWFLYRSTLEGVPIWHVRMPQKASSIAMRLVEWAYFHLVSTVVALLVGERPDVILVPSPPLTIGLSAWLVSRLRGGKYIYNVQELYPDIAISLGALRSPLAIRAARALEAFVYRQAAVVTAIAPAMAACLERRVGTPEKVALIPNFVDTTALHPLPRGNEFRSRSAFRDKFVVNYSGNIGPAQGVEALICAAELLKDNSEIHFVIVGGGSGFAAIRDHLAATALDNVTLLEYQPYTMMSQIYSASDVCVVPQATNTGGDAVPSKVYRIMACARPVIAITESASDLASLVLSSGCGVVVPAADVEMLASVITNAHREAAMWLEMGERGYRHVVDRYSRATVVREYDALVRTLAHRNSEEGGRE